MPKVPKRELSYGEDLEKIRRSARFANKQTPGTKQFPTYEFREPRGKSRNGYVKTTKPPTLPNPFKCSKCDYIASSSQDSKQHWTEH